MIFRHTIKTYVFWLLTAIFALILPADLFAQADPQLGVAFKPIIPSGLFDNISLDIKNRGVDYSIKPRPGYSAGVVLRQDLPRRITFETGIYYVRRIYDLDIKDSSGFSTHNSFRFVNYEVPLAGLIYIRLSENAYLSNTFGVSLDFLPNDVYTESEFYIQRANRKYWVLPGLMAEVGAEIRTPKAGTFYFGGSYHRMLVRMANTKIQYLPAKNEVTTGLSGHYFAFNFKYFFPTYRTAPVEWD